VKLCPLRSSAKFEATGEEQSPVLGEVVRRHPCSTGRDFQHSPQNVRSNLLLTRSSTMQRLRGLLERFSRDEDGVTMLEYTILIGIITVVVIASVVYAGTWVSGKWTALTAMLA